ncbi:MAG: Fic family protein [Eubacteriaceae bacterium]
MKNKYTLTKEQNIFLAKKKLVQNIYVGAKLEGSNITFPETQTILDGKNISSVTLDDIQTVLNLRDAWHYLLATIEDPTDLNYICKINEYVARNESLTWGVLRTGKVGISGTDHIPELPNEGAVQKKLEKILDPQKSGVEKAIDYFLYGTRSQLFWDGNKRTSQLVANKIMISEGAGIFSIPVDNEKALTFSEELTSYYTSGKSDELKKFIFENCIEGIEFMSERSIEKSIEKEGKDQEHEDSWELEL